MTYVSKVQVRRKVQRTVRVHKGCCRARAGPSTRGCRVCVCTDIRQRAANVSPAEVAGPTLSGPEALSSRAHDVGDYVIARVLGGFFFAFSSLIRFFFF